MTWDAGLTNSIHEPLGRRGDVVTSKCLEILGEDRYELFMFTSIFSFCLYLYVYIHIHVYRLYSVFIYIYMFIHVYYVSLIMYVYIYICLPCIHQKNDEDMASWGMAQRKMVQETLKHTVPSVILVGVQQHLSLKIIIPLGTIAIPQSNSWTLKIANVEWKVGKQPSKAPQMAGSSSWGKSTYPTHMEVS